MKNVKSEFQNVFGEIYIVLHSFLLYATITGVYEKRMLSLGDRMKYEFIAPCHFGLESVLK